ncbi:hypothetical protein CANCADRAFT_29688 [Tortispora caseinolytica NRRL Y-17796]|uniref:Lethal giant larvae (Lgl)-like C-terminal domain-containing protein n=1 Tax=Tortispora caseinolytica NRRL Y-17796 TaxID=767744 RepID=A0A1E4T9H5_9ASCO|nr:hypothetical protein CANCADRAFT_29688 [Tortispora caseinolytica NRRL Y-17796]
MFSKIKTIGKPNLSESISSNYVKLVSHCTYGVTGTVSATAFDPVQSLLAVATDAGDISVFGQPGVEVVFSLQKPVPIWWTRIVRGIYLVAIDTLSNITVFSLDTKQQLSVFSAPGKITAAEADPALDWLFYGLANGEVCAYDIDRGSPSPFKTNNLLRKSNAVANRRGTSAVSPILALKLHPRDVSCLLVVYAEAVLVLSLAQSTIIQTLVYSVPPGAPGGSMSSSHTHRYPRALDAVWHPNGHHILSVHDDSSLVFWDTDSGTLILARNLSESNINVPRSSVSISPFSNSETSSSTAIATKAYWCSSNSNTMDTQLIVIGGQVAGLALPGVTIIDFGPSPTISVTSFKSMASYYSAPKRQRTIPSPGIDPNSVPVDVQIFPQQTPHFCGTADPNYILVRYSSGELCAHSFPDGSPVNMERMFPPSLTWPESPISCVGGCTVPRDQWLGIMAGQPHVQPVCTGGAPSGRKLRRLQTRNVMYTGHKNGVLRFWDASYAEIDDSQPLRIDLTLPLSRADNVAVSHVSFSGLTLEAAVAASANEVVLYKIMKAKHHRPCDPISSDSIHMFDASHGIDKSIKEGFMPICILKPAEPDVQVSCLVQSNIGFVAVGYFNGTVAIVDRRGPAVIFSERLAALFKSSRIRRSAPQAIEYPTSLEFSITVVNDEPYSSIVMLVGTSEGRLATFRILPVQGGGFSAELVDEMHACDDSIIALCPYNSETGNSTIATPEVMAQLGKSVIVPGAIAVISGSEIRVVKPAKSKLSHKVYSASGLPQQIGGPIVNAGLCTLRMGGDSVGLVCISAKGNAALISLPGLSTVATSKVPESFRNDLQYPFTQRSSILISGDIMIQSGVSQGLFLSIWNTQTAEGVAAYGQKGDQLYDPLKSFVPRPTIGTIQWIAGRQYISIADLDELLGGSKRPKSKAAIEEQGNKRSDGRGGKVNAGQYQSKKGTWNFSNMQKSLNESMNNVEEQSNETFKSIGEFFEDQKTSFAKGVLKGKMGL